MKKNNILIVSILFTMVFGIQIRGNQYGNTEENKRSFIYENSKMRQYERPQP